MGANPTIRDISKKSAREHAVLSNHPEIADMLELAEKEWVVQQRRLAEREENQE